MSRPAASEAPFEVGMKLLQKVLTLLLTGLLAGSVSNAAQAQSCGRPANRPFQIFDATAYVGRPDWSRYGIRPIHIVDRGLWPASQGRSGPPDPVLVRRYLESLPHDGAPIVLDNSQHQVMMYRNHRSISL